MKVEERKKARIKVLNRWTIMNTENCKGQPRKCVQQKKKIDLKVLECMEEANKRNENM